MVGTPSISTLGRFAIDYPSPVEADTLALTDFDVNSTALECISENVAMRQTHYDSPGLRGTRSQRKERTRITQEACGGSIVMNPTRAELNFLFPLIMGNTTKSTNNWLLGETVPLFNTIFDRVQKRFAYGNCKVAKATFKGSQGGPIELTLDIEATLEITGTTTWATLAIPAAATADIYIMADTTFALGADASATEVAEWTITIDNALKSDRFMNRVTRKVIPAQDRIITLEMTVPYTGDEVDLYDQAIAGNTATLTLTDPSANTTVFTFANVKATAQSPVIGGRGDEIMLTLPMRAYSTSAADQNELIVTHA